MPHLLLTRPLLSLSVYYAVSLFLQLLLCVKFNFCFQITSAEYLSNPNALDGSIHDVEMLIIAVIDCYRLHYAYTPWFVIILIIIKLATAHPLHQIYH
jgi:hypothetical protein